MLMYVTLIFIPLVAAFFSLSLFSRGELGTALWTWIFTVMATGLVFAGIVPATATAATGPDNIRETRVIDNGVLDTSINSGSTRYVFTSNGKEYSLESNMPEETDTSVVDARGTTPRWEVRCDETPDWAAPFTMSECHNYLFVPMEG